MLKTLIFAGTTEGRELAEFCTANNIPADVSTATEYGASLLPEKIGVLSGRLDREGMEKLFFERKYTCVIDATHPYAAEVTANIKQACEKCKVPYVRLLRETVPVFGETAADMKELIEKLNKTDSVILSTLGSKAADELSKISHCFERVWLRMLPGDAAEKRCVRLGFDKNKLILEKGPFDTERNIQHIKKSGAEILLTKESGTVGGYPEKAEAAKICGIRMLTLCRPQETGYGLEQIEEILIKGIRN